MASTCLSEASVSMPSCIVLRHTINIPLGFVPDAHAHLRLPFAFRASIVNFSRSSVFLQSACRRLMHLAASFLYDGASTQDFKSAKGRGQHSAAFLLRSLGFGWPTTETDNGPTCDFFGLLHDVSKARSHAK